MLGDLILGLLFVGLALLMLLAFWKGWDKK